MNNNFMEEAIKEAENGIGVGDGGPFGCVIVKDNKIVGRGHNLVVSHNDPTAHGEITAIRNACKNLGTFSLSGCQLYTTAEPCPMCLAAILWARIDKVYYGCRVADTAEIGFDDSEFYDALSGKKELCTLEELDREDCLKLFKKYNDIKDKTMY
ncbi:MAG: nucleoside deaminase [Lachnospirales bacterium]